MNKNHPSSHTGKIPTFVCYRNHFDLIWRRGWKRSYEMDGLRFRGYADLHEHIISHWMELAETEGAAFELEQTLSLREYLRRHPKALKRLRALAESGQLGLLGCGEAIIDVNQCHGEVMLRNLASGLHYAEQTLGLTPVIGGHYDGFGSSAQMPQVFRQAGLRWLAGLSYSKPEAPYWRGLDGSVVFARPDYFHGPGDKAYYFYDHCYYPPCSVCSGKGRLKKAECPDCQGSGFAWCEGTYPERAPFEPDMVNGYATLMVCSEEMLPDANLPAWVRAQTQAGSPYAFEWATSARMAMFWQDEMAACDRVPEDQVSANVENNPVQTGCLVTRMRVRQAARKAERTFLATERLLGLLALNGWSPATASLEKAWLDLPLLFFHDAITGTHIDPAQEELLDTAAHCQALCAKMADQAVAGVPGLRPLDPALRPGQRIRAFNPADRPGPLQVRLPRPSGPGKPRALSGAEGQASALRALVPSDAGAHSHLIALRSGSPLRPASSSQEVSVIAEAAGLSLTTLKVVADSEPEHISGFCTDNRLLGLTWDAHGLTQITDLRCGKAIASKKTLRPNTLILEHDTGDPWGTRDLHRPRRDLQQNTHFVSARRYTGCSELVFAGAFMENRRFAREPDPNVFGLEWTQTVRLWDGVARVDFVTEIYWKAVNRRIRVAFPTPARSDTGYYGIPAGYLERERYDMTETRLYSPNGDWPAVDFFSTRPTARRPGTALFNRGTVSSRIEDGTLLMSLLRAPGFGHCLERYAQDYPMPLYHVRDPGYHCFEYAVAPVTEVAEAAAQAEAWNWPTPLFSAALGRVPTLPPVCCSAPEVAIMALKPAFDGQGWILRLLNRSPRTVTARIELPPKAGPAREVNIRENDLDGKVFGNDSLCLNFTPWQIRTIRLSGRPTGTEKEARRAGTPA